MIEAQRLMLSAKSRALTSARAARYLATCPPARAAHRLRSALRAAIFSAHRRTPPALVGLLGCTIDELRDHLEAQFSAGMSWDNHGAWHLDHIRPCCAFDLTKPEQAAECFHFSNLRPVWQPVNAAKIPSDVAQSVWPRQELMYPRQFCQP